MVRYGGAWHVVDSTDPVLVASMNRCNFVDCIAGGVC